MVSLPPLKILLNYKLIKVNENEDETNNNYNAN